MAQVHLNAGGLSQPSAPQSQHYTGYPSESLPLCLHVSKKYAKSLPCNHLPQEVGYDCIQWNPVIYDDLLRWGDGTGPGLIKAYFSKLGWPTMLSTKDRPAFVEKVYVGKVKALKEMVQAGDIPLRQGTKVG